MLSAPDGRLHIQWASTVASFLTVIVEFAKFRFVKNQASSKRFLLCCLCKPPPAMPRPGPLQGGLRWQS